MHMPVSIARIGLMLLALTMPLEAAQLSFEPLYHALKSLEQAVQVGVNYQKLQELVQQASTEEAIVRDKAESAPEKELLEKFAGALAVYRDSATLWQSKIETAQYDFLLGRIVVGFVKNGTLEPDPRIKAIVDRYHLPTETISLQVGGSFVGLSGDAPQVLWSLAVAQQKAANEAYSASQKSLTEKTSYLDELERLAKLRDKGVITAKDYEEKKRQLMGLPPLPPDKTGTKKSKPKGSGR